MSGPQRRGRAEWGIAFLGRPSRETKRKTSTNVPAQLFKVRRGWEVAKHD